MHFIKEYNMEEDNVCPICKEHLVPVDSSSNTYNDYHCTTGKNHFFAKRLAMGQLLKVKLRLPDQGNSYLYMKVNFDENSTQVWKKSSEKQRINIDHATSLDFSDIEKIKNKIKTYLLFS